MSCPRLVHLPGATPWAKFGDPPLTKQGGRTGLFTIEDFSYDAEGDAYTCPARETLPRLGRDYKRGYVKYGAEPSSCAGCPLTSRCTNLDTNPTPTWAVANGIGRTNDPMKSTKMCEFAAHFECKRTLADSSGRICTAEVRGSNPLGSTPQMCRFAR